MTEFIQEIIEQYQWAVELGNPPLTWVMIVASLTGGLMMVCAIIDEIARRWINTARKNNQETNINDDHTIN